MLRMSLVAAFFVASFAAHAQDSAVPADVQEKILTLLGEMQCEMDPRNIEADDGGYELDDVFCADGQYDIDLDADLKVTNKRKE